MINSLPISAVARLELKTLAREKMFLLLLGLFLSMTFFAVYIGWFTRTTTSAIYDATVVVLRAAGTAAIPANPVLSIPQLAVFDNLIIYVLLVGALLAIVIGHRSFMRERKSGVMPLLFVRPLSANAYVAGKFSGIALALLSVMSVTFVASGLSALFLPALHLSGVELLRLAAFYGVSFLYLSFFALVGFACAAYFSSESIALFVPILVWVGAVFVFPELATGQNPVALLNPITLVNATPNPSAFFSVMHSILTPVSLGQQYTDGAIELLQASSDAAHSLAGSLGRIGGALAGLSAGLLVLGAASVAAVRSYALSTDPLL